MNHVTSSTPPSWRLTATLTASLLVLSACGGSDNADNASAESACAVVSSTGSVVVGSGLPGDPAAPEPASGYRLGKTAVHAKQ